LIQRKSFTIFAAYNAEVAQLVEHQLPKLRVASSNLVFRSESDKAASFVFFTFISNTNRYFSSLKTYDVIIIGGGPAGLFAVINCKGLKTIVLEKNPMPGKKLLISGTGRCNITHDCKLSDFFTHYGENFRFLKTALHEFTNTDLIRFFEDHGLETVVDKNGKVFPASQRASDVLEVLVNICNGNKNEIACNQKVVAVSKTDSGFLVKTNSATFQSKYLIITTGGMSYPVTGSTGDGYHFAKQFGHSVIPPKPSLSPVFISDYLMATISGVSVQNKQIYLYRGNKKIYEHCGDIGFTHKGLSGPGILDFSRHILSSDVLKVNFLEKKPDEFRDEFIIATEREGKTAVQTYLKKFNLPRSLMILILQSIKI
jgi:predicted Rossmann fold flavoprotein